LSSLTKGLILVIVILGIGGALVVWKNKVGGHAGANFNSISQEELDTLVADIAKQDPVALKRLGADPEMKKQQLESLKQILAFASEAQREGLTNEKPYKQELENINAEVVAVNYDRDINKDKGPMPPFGFIGEDRVKAYWGEGDQPPAGWWENFKNKVGLGKEDHNIEFDKFIETKLTILGESNPKMKDHQLTDDERQQARDFFAKISILNDEYNEKLAKGPSANPSATAISRPVCRLANSKPLSVALLVVPFWVSAHNMVMIVVGVFLMQFFVQGAWGVVPAHINELSPGQYRGFFPGFAYQLGILCAASIPYVESVLGERFTYTQAMGGMMTVVFVLAITVMYFGPEARGVSFRKPIGAVPE